MSTCLADLDEPVSEVEARARRDGFSLGPLLVWCKDMRVREMLVARAGFRCNPALCRIEEVANGRGLPTDARRVELRLLPAHEEQWLRVLGRETAEVHAFIRALTREGLAPRAIWTELASGWLCMAGAMARTQLLVAEARARERGLDASASTAPVGAALSSGFVPALKSWETLGPRDSIVLADPWTVLAR